MINRMISGAAASLAMLVAGSVNGAVIYSTNFQTDQSASFTNAITSADTEVNFNYDYSTWTPTAPTAGITNIPLAPNSTAGQSKGLKMRSHFSVPLDQAGNEACTVFLNASTGVSSWVFTFDAFQLWNGTDPVNAHGSTTGFCIGDATTANPFYSGASTFDGWFLLMTGEGGQGATGDARYYTGATPTVNLATPNWALDGGAALPTDMGAASGWDTVFPTPTYPYSGLPGRQWATWELKANAGTITVSITAAGGAKHQVAKWSDTTNKSLGLGFWDLNTGSTATPPEDNFVVIDNLSLTTIPTAAQDWQYLQ